MAKVEYTEDEMRLAREIAVETTWCGDDAWRNYCSLGFYDESEEIQMILAAIRATTERALKAIAGLPTGLKEDVCEGQEQAYRIIEGGEHLK